MWYPTVQWGILLQAIQTKIVVVSIDYSQKSELDINTIVYNAKH